MKITAWTPVLSLLQNLPVSSVERRLTMITSSTEKLASYPVKAPPSQNEHDGDLEISSPGAANMNPPESLAFARGRRSLDRSVWYSGWLLTFLATAEETRGQFVDNGNSRTPLSARDSYSTISFFAISDAVRLDNPQLMLWERCSNAGTRRFKRATSVGCLGT